MFLSFFLECENGIDSGQHSDSEIIKMQVSDNSSGESDSEISNGFKMQESDNSSDENDSEIDDVFKKQEFDNGKNVEFVNENNNFPSTLLSTKIQEKKRKKSSVQKPNTRARLSYQGQWMRTVKKVAVNSGLSYVNEKGKYIPVLNL